MKKVVCLMPTFGRFNIALRSISMFLKQTYPNRELVVFNQSPVPITGSLPQVKVVNVAREYQGLWEIYEDALQHCDGDLLNFWDDDDGRFPWFLESTISNKRKKAAKSSHSWFWSQGRLLLQNNVLEPSWVLDFDIIRNVGFEHRKCFVHMKWVRWCLDHQEIDAIPATEVQPGFVYVWGQEGCYHSSASRDEDLGYTNFHKHSKDFGDGVLREVDVMPWYHKVTQSHPELRERLGLCQLTHSTPGA